MNNLNELQARFDVLCTEFNEYRLSEFMTGLLPQDAFMQKHASLVAELGALEKVIKELSNGMYTFNSNGTVSVTYFSHFRNGRFHHDLDYKTVEFSFIECLMNLKGLNINKHLLLKTIA